MSATPENSSIRPEALLCADWLRYVAAGGSAGVQDGQYKSLLLTAAEQLEAMHGALTVPVPDHFPGVRKMVEPALSPLEKVGDAIGQALDECPVADVLSILSGALVGLAVELVRRQGHDVSKSITLNGVSQRDITISAAKPPEVSRGGAA